MSALRDGESAVRVRVYGKVQGVWYRGWTVETAMRLGLFGWVRNREDGTVEALFCGPQTTLDTMLEEARKGPDAAQVERIVSEPAKGIAPRRFDIKPTV